MPLDDYASAVGGGLKLKGAKVTKPKKKKRRDKTDLEKNLETGGDDDGSSTALVKQHREESTGDDNENTSKSKSKSKKNGKDPKEERDKDDDDDDEEGGSGRVVQKTEAERRSRPELLKTHKERVEELNTYLSKLSEHHDMPKIGPG
ncbi:hypothetical protein CFIO01_09549 [Colletotrichum fioriniae PJ7]|uniref:DUF1754-domain-containing protein n=1 Tax=Colletotrichum fioriniae PJ7 TaxID=1445577 RepID=A0A010SAF3_9PEZI|nr:hypothetical protein CFIO01_09549 [Colletotrichum fioriniae PJ7]